MSSAGYIYGNKVEVVDKNPWSDPLKPIEAQVATSMNTYEDNEMSDSVRASVVDYGSGYTICDPPYEPSKTGDAVGLGGTATKPVLADGVQHADRSCDTRRGLYLQAADYLTRTFNDADISDAEKVRAALAIVRAYQSGSWR